MTDDADITIGDGMFTGVWANHILIETVWQTWSDRNLPPEARGHDG